MILKQRMIALSSVSLIAALFSWACVGYMAWQILSMEHTRAELINKVEQANARQTSAARTHAILQETAAERAVVIDRSRVDVLSIVNTIESVGKSAGVVLQVKGAQPSPPIAARAGVRPLRPIQFSIQTTGPFGDVVHALELLEHMPFPTDITQIEISRPVLDELGPRTVEPWRASVILRLLTTSDISS